MASGNNIQSLREARGWSRPELGRRMNTSGQQVERLEKGQRKLTQEWMERAAAALGVVPADLIGEAPAPTPATAPRSAHAPTRSADAGETAAVMRMDLSYAMGAGTNIDHDYIEQEPVVFDISFLRRLTPSPPHMLRIVSGIGDSMFPTIHDSEELILDLGQRVLNLQDRIWAMSLFGVGAVKRLQAVDKKSVLVISDNPDVPNREVSTDDIFIVGRIVGSVKRH